MLVHQRVLVIFMVFMGKMDFIGDFMGFIQWDDGMLTGCNDQQWENEAILMAYGVWGIFQVMTYVILMAYDGL